MRGFSDLERATLLISDNFEWTEGTVDDVYWSKAFDIAVDRGLFKATPCAVPGHERPGVDYEITELGRIARSLVAGGL